MHHSDSPTKFREKLPIPAVQWKARKEKFRTRNACEQCRRRKSKCDGARPKCGNCSESLLDCAYSGNKRERDARHLQALEAHTKRLEAFLGDIYSEVHPERQLAIQALLNNGKGQTSWGEDDEDAAYRHHEHSVSSEEHGEESNAAESGSTGTLNRLEDDVNILSVNKPIGFMGKGSEVSWVRRLMEEICNEIEHHGDVDGIEKGSTYHLDDLDMSILHSYVDVRMLPDMRVAEALMESYFGHVHPVFPLIHQETFVAQHHNLYELGVSSVSRKWLASYNLVLAIGAVHHNMNGSGSDDACHHLDFFMRARILGALDGGVLLEISTLSDIQVVALTGMYLLASHQTNRAWSVAGLAVRLAHAIGLHLHNDAPGLSNFLKEMCARTWYSICYIESTLCMITGRPSALQLGESNMSIPRSGSRDALPDEHSGDVYFSVIVNLNTRSTEVLRELYSVFSMIDKKNWSEVQGVIRNLQDGMERWRLELPDPLRFESDMSATPGKLSFQKTDLAFRYLNIIMIIHYPCICKFDQSISPLSQHYRELKERSINSCVRAARSVITYIIQQDGVADLPWWCVLHYFVSAAAILMLVCVRNIGYSDETAALNLLDNALRWLEAPAKTDLACERTLAQLSMLLKQVRIIIMQR